MTPAEERGAAPAAIGPGTILMQDDVVLPESVHLETESYCTGWATITSPSCYEIDRRMRNSGWTFFFMGNLIRSTVLGFNRDKSLKAALSNLMRDAVAERCNAIQIESVTARRFLGMPYVSVSAHSRQFQQSMVFGCR